MKAIPFLNLRPIRAMMLGAAVCLLGWSSPAQAQAPQTQGSQTQISKSTNELAQTVGATATEVTQTALNKVDVLWKRIDEKRLKNRTFDELVAWALMGLLVGAILYRIKKSGQVTMMVLGLLGAFLGGILSNVFQLDLGLGPVLIRYEDLLCSLLGGLVLLFAWGRWIAPKRAPAPAKGEPAKEKAPAK